MSFFLGLQIDYNRVEGVDCDALHLKDGNATLYSRSEAYDVSLDWYFACIQFGFSKSILFQDSFSGQLPS
jgi:hypothetical protein